MERMGPRGRTGGHCFALSFAGRASCPLCRSANLASRRSNGDDRFARVHSLAMVASPAAQPDFPPAKRRVTLQAERGCYQRALSSETLIPRWPRFGKTFRTDRGPAIFWQLLA